MAWLMTSFPPPSTSEPTEVNPAKREEQAKALCLRLLTARPAPGQSLPGS